ASHATARPAYDQFMKEAESVLLNAKDVPGYNRRWWHLEELYSDWAESQTNATRRAELALQARHAGEEALRWEQKNAPLWAGYASINLFLLSHEPEGLNEMQHALELDPGCEQARGRLADYFAKKSKETDDQESKREFARKAAISYRQA